MLEQRPERYLRSPFLRAHHKGGATLYAIAWEVGRGERILAVAVDRWGAKEGPVGEGPLLDAIPSLAPGEPPTVEHDPAAALRTRHGESGVSITHEAGVAEVWLDRAGTRTLVWRARGCAAAPAVAETPNGTWVAWHHDVREDRREGDVAKWIALRFVDREDRVLAPVAPMRGRDRDEGGVEQSFEFPVLVAHASGALTLFGRGSHNFWRQDLTDAGFSERMPLGDGDWGSRGRRMSACVLEDGAMLSARREKVGVKVERHASPEGGRPRLEPADVDWESARRPSVSLSDRRDPATRHGLHTYFGDLQQHSAHSDGIGTADEAYLRARHRYGDDFVALTDHESFLGKRTGPGEWRYLQEVANRYDDEGAFATLVAYEWTGKRFPGPGHKCVYFRGERGELVSRDDVPEGRALVEQIKRLGGFASPHHIGWTGCDEEGHDPEGQPLWEICSCHGCYEHADHPLGQRGELTNQLADAMLQKGHRFGFSGSSDSHGLLWHHGESRKRDPFRTGLTAVQAPSLSRGAIFDALKSRRCYATSGAKILLDFRVGGQPMGSELDARGPTLVQAEAVGEGDLASLELVTEAGVVARADASGLEGTLEATVSGRYVYLRVTQRDGEMAWASPVFLTRR